MSADLERALRAELPDNVVVTDPDLIASYLNDMARFCASGVPTAVVLPRDTAQVQAALRIAHRLGVVVVPQGARTGLSGGANAVDGCIVVSLERMNRILEIDAANRLAVVEPGVLNATLSRAVAEVGLFYPPDPASWEISTIGGNVATNAGGLCCVKYGVTGDFVMGVEVVLADGDLLRTGRRTVKGVAGYDLTRLFVGSEGTLGIITQVTLALRPAPQAPLTVAALFSKPSAAADAVAAVTAAGHVPSLLEFMDRTTLRAVNSYRNMGIPSDAAAMLIAQSDAADGQARREVEAMAACFTESGATEVALADDPGEGDMLLAARRAVHFALKTLGTTRTDDVCVPRSRLADFVERVERVADAAGLTIAVVGHAGDGNTHTTVVFDAADEAQAVRAKQASEDIMAVGLELGGTITGEHGVGLLKAGALESEIGAVAMRVHRGIKQVLDPQGTLNPGKVFAPTPERR